MSPLKFKLKQHTPIIHFLSDQPGATLRATELKPKLDKFLIKHAFKNDFEQYKTHLIGWKEGKRESDFRDKMAFDYKVTIYAGDKKTKEKGYNKSLYFGHIGNKDEKKAVLYEGVIDVKFFSFNEKLIDSIKEYFAPFLAQTNFGTRQNKGFGSFFQTVPTCNFLEELKKTVPCFFYIEYTTSDYSNKFNDIEIIYKLMKSGINYPDHPMIPVYDKNGKPVIKSNQQIKKEPNFKVKRPGNFYFKSFLTDYFNKQQIPVGNEKRFIKENFFRPDLRVESDKNIKRYVRAVLGVCDGVEYKGDKKKGRNGNITYKSRDIDRFKSPLTFKIVDNYTVIIPEDIPKEKLSGIKFTFSHEFPPKKIHTKPIDTPDLESFDLISFLKEYMDYFNNLDLTTIKGNTSTQAKLVKHAKQSTIKCYEKGGAE